MTPGCGIGRREFLARCGGGLSGMALAALLDDGSPIRPAIDPAAPLHARAPHFRPRAKRVLYLFCSGALSQLDTFDWKPELVRRDGEPLPGGEGLVTFQGEQGNLTRSPWSFRPRGECGKWTSDLLPHLGARVDRLCFCTG